MIGVSNRAPKLPRLVIVKVPPDELVRTDLVGAGALGDVGDLLGQPGDREVAGVLDDRGQQALLGVDGERDVLAVEVGHLARLGVDRRVERGVLLERVDRGLGEERQVRQLHALARQEVGLRRARAGARSLVTSTSITWVSWADVCSDSTIRLAMTLRSREIFSVVPRSGDGRDAGAGAARRSAAGGRGGRRAGRGLLAPWRRRARPACGSGHRRRCPSPPPGRRRAGRPACAPAA